MHDVEKLGAFYLGRRHDLDTDAVTDEPLLYDSKDLTTHAACIGMTGSGKTGLCVALLEEAALDGVPVIAIDPKGDVASLALRMPELQPRDFRPWIDPGDAARHGRSLDQEAAEVAKSWHAGLARWGQDGDRIRRLEASGPVTVYTPGSSSGRPLGLLRSFTPPPAGAREADAVRERIVSAASGLLALVGVDADPVRSRGHVLVSSILEHAWSRDRSLDLPRLIREIQSPPFTRVGVFDLESFFPAAERLELAMRLNNLLASPGFATWMDGEPLHVPSLLHAADGRPRTSVLSIAHLSDAERMFFVTTLLNEVLSWMRSQPGTSSLRAILFMDEVFGYLPPTASPPSKRPLLTLLKQARASGLGLVLATQNPVDLDYKALSNCGTWFLGRLQTQRDRDRVLDGLETAGAGSGTGRDELEATLGRLPGRVFVMRNVHDEGPVAFHVRWVLSYLRGPLTREQLAQLPGPDTDALPDGGETVTRAVPAADPTAEARVDEPVETPPAVPPDVPVVTLAVRSPLPAGARLAYRPAILAEAELHFAETSSGLDEWRTAGLLAAFPGRRRGRVDWEGARRLDGPPELAESAEPRAVFTDLPPAAADAGAYPGWGRALKAFLYREETLPRWRCARPRRRSAAGESEGDFRARLAQAERERRDLDVGKLRSKHERALGRLQDRVRRAEAQVAREEAQYGHQKLQAAVSVGATLLGALFGRKVASVGTVGRAGSAVKGASRAARERGDVERARERLEELRAEMERLEAAFEEEVEALDGRIEPTQFEVTPAPVRPRKADLQVTRLALAWTPWSVDAAGIAEPLH